MPDITAIASALSSIKLATDLAKLLLASGITLKDAEQKLKVAELITSLADVKIQLAEVQQVILEKEKRVQELEEQVNLKAKMRWEQPYYWLVDGEKKEGPFCQQCYDKTGKPIRLIRLENGWWDCKTCKSVFRDSNFSRPQVKVESDFDP